MLHTVKTFNGHNINDSSFRTQLLNPHGVPNANPVFIDQANADSIDAGVYTVDVQNKILNIKILNYANRYALIAQLKTWFKRGTIGNLVVTFGDDGVDYQISARVVALVQDPNNGQYWTATLQTGFSAWRAVTETTESTWTVSGTSATHDITVAGKDETFLSLDLTASAGPASGYLYQNILRLPNPDGVVLGYIPWCITVNTSALVSGSKMQADCDDLRIVDMSTGQEIRRWISGPNTTTTKVWINLDFAKGFSLTLGTAIVGTGDITALQFSVTSDMQAAINEMPANGIMYHGNEWIAYSGKDAVNCKLTVSQRGLFGTTKESHSAGVAFLYIQYPLLMKYGNSTVSAPATNDAAYDNYKPVLDLASSSNTLWCYGGSSTLPFENSKYTSRTAGWTFVRRAFGPNSYIYYFKRLDVLSNKAVVFVAAGYVTAKTYNYDNIELTATLFHGAGISSVMMTGEKRRGDSAWISTAAVRASIDGVTYTILFNEAAPSTIGPSAWEGWAYDGIGVSAPTGSKYVQVIFAGVYQGLNSVSANFEMLTCAATINSANLPTGAFLGEASGLPLATTIENLTTGDLIRLDYIILLNKTLSIDGETNDVQYDSYNAFGAISLDDEGRSVYLRLQGGVTNSIKITGSDLGEMDVDLHWYRRRL